MILTISDLLEEIKNKGLSKIELETKGITQTTTIGNIYEGFTSEILNEVIFQNFDLRIVQNSFVYNEDKEVLSDEIDCMLVTGEGEKIIHTKDQFKYHISDVIVIFQVKKNLFQKDIEDAHKNLFSVVQLSEERNLENYEKHIFRDAYRALNSREIPLQDEKENLTDREKTIYQYLYLEALNPIRIVIGYYGYANEYTLRKGFIEILEKMAKKGNVSGYHPQSFPSLYICGNSTIIKNNGMPMGIPLTNDEFYFPILVTSTGKPMFHLLELIWTRLSYKFGISSTIFGDDFDVELAHSFLFCKEEKINDLKFNWSYSFHHLSKKELEKPLASIPWKPIELNKTTFTIVNILLKKGEIDIINDSAFLDFLNKNNIILESFIEELLDKKLIYIKGNKMKLFLDEPLIVTQNGVIYIGENKNLEMATYFNK